MQELQKLVWPGRTQAGRQSPRPLRVQRRMGRGVLLQLAQLGERVGTDLRLGQAQLGVLVGMGLQLQQQVVQGAWALQTALPLPEPQVAPVVQVGSGRRRQPSHRLAQALRGDPGGPRAEQGEPELQQY